MEKKNKTVLDVPTVKVALFRIGVEFARKWI